MKIDRNDYIVLSKSNHAEMSQLTLREIVHPNRGSIGYIAGILKALFYKRIFDVD